MHVLITGAATGIGEATVENIHRKFPSAGFTILDKNQHALQETCERLTKRGIRAHGVACDLTEIDALPDLVRRAEADMGDIELLVNNAGIMLVEDFSTMSWEKGMLTMNLNLIAPVRLMHAVLPGMLARGKGGIINIASMAGKALLPGCSWYGASKAGIGHASEIIQGEVKDKGVHVLTVYPGPIATKLEKGARAGYEENWVSKLLPVGDRFQLAERIVNAYMNKETVLAYPEVYDVARHFHSLTGVLANMFAPRTRS